MLHICCVSIIYIYNYVNQFEAGSLFSTSHLWFIPTFDHTMQCNSYVKHTYVIQSVERLFIVLKFVCLRPAQDIGELSC